MRKGKSLLRILEPVGEQDVMKYRGWVVTAL